MTFPKKNEKKYFFFGFFVTFFSVQGHPYVEMGEHTFSYPVRTYIQVISKVEHCSLVRWESI